MLAPHEKEMVAAAVQQARQVAVEVAMSTRGGVVTGVDPTNSQLMVSADGPTGDVTGSFGADNVSGLTLQAGDRVMVMFAHPHGALVIGRRTGDYDDWHTVGTADEPEFTGGNGVFWDHAAGTVFVGQDGPAQLSFTRRSGLVTLMGRAARVTGASDNVFELPEGYRPYNDLLLRSSTTLGASSVVTIDQLTGILSAAGGDNLVVVDGISFLAVPVMG